MEGPRCARLRELEEVIELSNRVFRRNGEGDMGKEYPLLFSPRNCENLRIIKEDEKIVSLVGMIFSDIIILGNKIKVSMIGSVATDPDYRGRGYATLLMQDSILKSVQEGADIMLISGGRGLYRRLGAINAGLYRTFHIDKAKTSSIDLSVRRAGKSDVSKLLKLMEMEPVRFLRSYEELEALLNCTTVVNRPGDVIIIEKDNNPLAYMAVQIPKRQEEIPHIKEIGGCRVAITDALYSVMKLYERDSILLDTIKGDSIEYIMNKSGIRGEDRGFMGTVKVINIKGLMKKLEPYFRRTLGENFKSLTIEFGSPISIGYVDERLDIEDIDIPALLFGSTEKKIEMPDSLKTLFPIPLVDYGLNYT